MTISVSQINIYPLKSAAPVELQKSIVEKRGLVNDRRWMLIDENGQGITAREFPQMLSVQYRAQDHKITFSHPKSDLTLDAPGQNNIKVAVKIFSAECKATAISAEADQWFSNYLKTNCRLVYMRDEDVRAVGPKSNGQEGDVVSFADENPLLLISEASLAQLNCRLEKPVTMKHFRPNIVVKGTAAFEEDQWKTIQIGHTQFRVAQACKRCIFTTLDPTSLEFRPDKEPLKTMAKFRYDSNKNGVVFGMHLIPVCGQGEIKIDNEVEVLS